MKHGLENGSGREPFSTAPVGRGRRIQPQRAGIDALHVNEVAFTYYPRLSAVAEYARAHVKERLTLAHMAQLAGLEKKYFSVYFRSKVGIPFTEWLRLLRVIRAKDLMVAREVSIPRLAFACGFRDVRTFERAFKRLLGVSPAAFRASVRPESRQS